MTNYTSSTNPLLDPAEYHSSVDYSDQMTLRQVRDAGGKVTRIRILGGGPSDGFYADISYIHATLPSGKVVPLYQNYPMCFPIRKLKSVLIEWAKEEGVFGKALGILDEGVWDILR
jgi:hypothetical protein